MWPFSQWPVEVSSSHIHAIHPIHMSHLSEPFPALSVLEICCRKKHITHGWLAEKNASLRRHHGGVAEKTASLMDGLQKKPHHPEEVMDRLQKKMHHSVPEDIIAF